MTYLSRMKKKDSAGFEQIVRDLEVLPIKKKWDRSFMMSIEDPIYMSYVVKNLLSIDKVTTLDKKSFFIFCEKTPNIITLLYFAFHNRPQEKEILEMLAPKYKELYDEENERNLSKEVSQGLRESAMGKLISSFRNLSDGRNLELIQISSPPVNVLNFDKSSPPTTHLKRFYENGTCALEGEIKRKLRMGPWKIYYSSGQLMAQGEYVEGMMENLWSFYYPKGTKMSEGHFRKNIKINDWKEFNAKGEISIVNYGDKEAIDPELERANSDLDAMTEE
jgi:hypothetical protein